MYLIDTNIHVAYLLQKFETDQLTREYISLYSGINLKDRVIPDFILAEFEIFMMQVVPSRYKLNIEDKQKLKQLTLNYLARITDKCTVIGTEVETVQKARDIFFENVTDHYLSFFDCLILASAQANNFHIISKDQKLKAKAKLLQIPLYEPRRREERDLKGKSI